METGPQLGGGGLALAELADLDEHRARIDAVIAAERHNPVGALQAVQRELGFLPSNVLPSLAEQLGLPLARVYGLATFYESLRLQPQGRHVLRVCRGTACHVAGAPRIAEVLEEHLGIATGETTEDGAVTLESAACVGCCSLAPVLAAGEETWGRLDLDKARAVADALRAEEVPA